MQLWSTLSPATPLSPHRLRSGPLNQTYASGGYGPGEWSVPPPDGSLGQAFDVRLDTAEIPCGSWAGFKLSRYLMSFTGEARFGDLI